MQNQTVSPGKSVAPPVLLVNVQPEACNTAVLQLATSIASRIGATVLGVAAWQPFPIDWTAGDYRAQDVGLKERERSRLSIGAAEAQFHAAFPHPTSKWRSSVSYSPPSAYLIDQSGQADLVLTGMPPGDASDDVRSIPGDLVIQSSRPVLLVPAEPTDVFDQIMVAYRDTPECRRAMLAAMPFLLRASRVEVVEVASAGVLPDAGRRLVGVVARLLSQGVVAEAHAVAALHDDAEQLEHLARGFGAGLIVAGAWGHGRVREWIFGGVTRRFLQAPPCCTLLAH